MASLFGLHRSVADKQRRSARSALLAALAALSLAACGDMVPGNATIGDAKALLDPAQVARLLPPEAQAIVTSYTGDLRAAALAYKAQYGQLPASFADVASVAGARATAVNVIADGLAEQVPFASRETLEKAANGVVTTAERQLLSAMRTQNAPNQ